MVLGYTYYTVLPKHILFTAKKAYKSKSLNYKSEKYINVFREAKLNSSITIFIVKSKCSTGNIQ